MLPPMGQPLPPFSQIIFLLASFHTFQNVKDTMYSWFFDGNLKKNILPHTPHQGQPHMQFFNFRKILIINISRDYEPISTKFSEISLLTRRLKLGKKNLKYVTPWGQPHPQIRQMLNISAIFEPIRTKFSHITPLTNLRKMAKKKFEICYPLGVTPPPNSSNVWYLSHLWTDSYKIFRQYSPN